jgi:hypothetical protein
MIQMTERKMCEFIEGCAWEPLSPQPCCANCRFIEHKKAEWWDYYQCGEITKTVQSGNDPVSTSYEIKNLDFHCSYWELEE